MSSIKVNVNHQNPLSVTKKEPPKILVNQGQSSGARRIFDMLDVDISARTDGAILVYDESGGKFFNSESLSLLTDGLTISGNNELDLGINSLRGYIKSNTGDILNSSSVTNMVKISQEDYDDLLEYDPNTIYFII